MKSILSFIFLVNCFYFGNSQTIAEHYQTKDFDVAIFPEEYQLHGFEKRFTPTKDEILLAETALQNQLKKINKNLPNQSHSPVIHKNLNKYRRQYFGILGENDERILYINSFWDDELSFWLDNEVSVDDGGSYYWQIKYSIDANKLFDLIVNGYS